nr:Maf family protein [Sphaerochaetaceae bacterium]
GKPKNAEEAASMYRFLSGKKHSVLSGVCMYIPGRGMTESCCVRSDVYFRELSEEDIKRYIETGDYKGVAGAYRIQSYGYTLMEKISGSLSNIIGLPLEKMLELYSN